jgi:tripartite-type tricarboxylate transporter receptor subunit TctC
MPLASDFGSERITALSGREIMNRLGAWLAMAATTAVTFAAPPTAASAQDYPTKPIRLVVVTAAGGLMDVAARVTAEHVGNALGQRIVIENRAGSGGNLGAEAVARAEPDGHTIGLIQLGNVAINPHVYTDMTFDPLNDLVPVAPVTTSAMLVIANAKLPVTDLRELIALAKREPGKLSYGSGGAGTAPHLAGEMFKAVASIDILHVPYRGVGPAVNDLVGGHIQLTFAGWGAVRSPVDAGLAKILAVAQARRLAAAPQFPTTAEAGLPGYEFATWFGIVAPKGTPAAAIATLVRHIHAMQDDPQIQRRLGESGLEALKESPERFGARMRRDYERLGPIVKAAKLKPE